MDSKLLETILDYNKLIPMYNIAKIYNVRVEESQYRN